MYVMETSTHHAESCPVFNKDVRKATAAVIQKMPAVLEKHGIKSVGGWVNLGTHTSYLVYETPSLDAFWACLNEPGIADWLAFNTVKLEVVFSIEEFEAFMA